MIVYYHFCDKCFNTTYAHALYIDFSILFILDEKKVKCIIELILTQLILRHY